MFKLSAKSVQDFFEKFTFDAQCLYGCVVDRPLKTSDIGSLNPKNDFMKTFYKKLSHDEQKEFLKAVLSSKPSFDLIVDRLYKMEKNIVEYAKEYNKNLKISTEQLNDSLNRETYSAISFAMKNLSECIAKLSPSVFQKITIMFFEVGINVDNIVEEIAQENKKKLKEIDEFIKNFDKLLPPLPENEFPPLDLENPDDDGDGDKFK